MKSNGFGPFNEFHISHTLILEYKVCKNQGLQRGKKLKSNLSQNDPFCTSLPTAGLLGIITQEASVMKASLRGHSWPEVLFQGASIFSYQRYYTGTVINFVGMINAYMMKCLMIKKWVGTDPAGP